MEAFEQWFLNKFKNDKTVHIFDSRKTPHFCDFVVHDSPHLYLVELKNSPSFNFNSYRKKTT